MVGELLQTEDTTFSYALTHYSKALGLSSCGFPKKNLFSVCTVDLTHAGLCFVYI